MGDTDTWVGFSYSGYYGHGDYGSDDDCYNGQHEPNYSRTRTVICKFCNVKGLHWCRYRGKQRLFDVKGNLHICNDYTGKPVLKFDKHDSERTGNKIKSALQSKLEREKED
jgi:hypothetical protein